MTKPMPDADLADLRNMLKRSNMFVGEIRGSFTTEEALVPLDLLTSAGTFARSWRGWTLPRNAVT